MNRKWIWIGAAVVVLAVIGALTRDENGDEHVEDAVSSEVDSVTMEPYSSLDSDPAEETMEASTLPPITERNDLDQSEVEAVVTRSVSSAFHESIEVDGRSATVVFRKNNSDDVYIDYFTTGDKTNKVLAIESARWFRDLPSLERLTLTVPAETGSITVELDRLTVERYYNVDFDELRADESLDSWRAQISEPHNNKEPRAEFVRRFRK